MSTNDVERIKLEAITSPSRKTSNDTPASSPGNSLQLRKTPLDCEGKATNERPLLPATRLAVADSVNAMKQIIMVRIFLILLYSFFGFQPYFYDSARSIFILHRLEGTAKSPQYQQLGNAEVTKRL